MTIVVLLFLAGIWAAVLIPPVLRARQEGRPSDSIGSFRRQLRVLERTGPLNIPPAHRLMTGPRPLPPLAITAPTMVPVVARSRESMARKRRRDVFLGLLAAMGGSLLLGLIPALRVMWTFHVMLDVIFVGYVAILVKMRNEAAERDMKLRFLPSAGQPTAEPVLRRTAIN